MVVGMSKQHLQSRIYTDTHRCTVRSVDALNKVWSKREEKEPPPAVGPRGVSYHAEAYFVPKPAV